MQVSRFFSGAAWRKTGVLPIALAAVFGLVMPAAATGLYPWLSPATATRTIENAVSPPPGFERGAVLPGSFAAWLRALPLKADGTPVLLFNGALKPRQDVHAAIIDIDIGNRDLQQCADAIMRLRAEWQFATARARDIAFNFTGGGRVPFSRFAKGERPDASGKVWKKSTQPDVSYATLRRYLDLVFAFAGTASLGKELKSVAEPGIQIGDVFIKSGFPGHAVLVADMAENKLTSSKRFLLVQSFMPAQDMHIVKNPANGDGSPWYAVPSDALVTPEWTFPQGSLKRWP